MTHASLFSGIGGPEVAAAMLGWENAFHCEINPFGRQVLEYWFPDSVSYEDITKTNFKEWRGRIDVLTGGFPCQPFSYAGQRRGQDDDRYLWPQMLRAIDEIRPTWVVGENVAGITTMVEGWLLADLGGSPTLFQEGDELHGYELEQSFTIERICRDLEHLGYSVQPVLIPAAAVGAPHRRDRIFICAHRDGDNLNGRVPKREIPWKEEPESAGYGTRLQYGERYDLRGDAADTDSGGHARPAQEVGESINALRSDRESYKRRDSSSANPDGPGREESIQPGREEDCPEGGTRVHDRTERPRRNAASPDTDRRDREMECEMERKLPGRHRLNCDGGKWDAAGMHPEKRWANFPTISPVHRGNDGLPFDVDGLSIPFSKWRTEALKAYGNAIVPQVMYQIFKAIETI